MSSPSDRIVVTGLGIISSLGIGKRETWHNVLAGKIRRTVQSFQFGDETDRYHFFSVEDPKKIDSLLDEETLAEIRDWKGNDRDGDVIWAAAVAKLAISDSGLRIKRNQNRIALFVSHENPGLEAFFDRVIKKAWSQLPKVIGNKGRVSANLAQFKYKMYQECIKSGYDAQTFIYLYILAKALGVHGYTSFSCNACASGLFLMEAAARDLRVGRSEAAILIASDHPAFPYKFRWFKDQGLYAQDGLIKPYDYRRKGFCIGDGAAAIVLETLGHARARKAKLYAEYLGGGFGCQSWKVTVPNLKSRTYARTIRDAMSSAGIRASDIDAIVSHGVGTLAGDLYEAAAIREVLGGKKKQPPLTALKPYIGHTLGASALVELVLLILCMQEALLLPTLNTETIDSRMDLNLVRSPMQGDVKVALKLASGFAGYDASIILRGFGI